MDRFILIAAFFAFLVSTEVVITALASQAFGICMADLAADGESEKDSKEKSEDDNKIEILVINKAEEEDTFSKSLTHPEKSIFSYPYLDQATPPPEI